MSDIKPVDIVAKKLKSLEVDIGKMDDRYIYTSTGFCIEMEGAALFRLSHLGDVIAPFDDIDELCWFIKDNGG